MSEYVYLPDYDGEFSIMSRQEYDAEGGADEFGPAVPADLLFNLEGHRGHYLAADFILTANAHLEECEWPRVLTSTEERRVDDAVADATTYDRHQGLDSGVPACDPMCGSCEFIVESADAVEAVLGDLGCVVEWDDGVRVYRVEDDKS